MTVIHAAIDLLRPGETGLVLTTDGTNLRLDRDGTGVSGWWIVDSQRRPDRVIIHQPVAGRTGLLADIFTAEFAGFEGPDQNGRFAIQLRYVFFAGLTDQTWKEFAETNQNPIRHLSRPTA